MNIIVCIKQVPDTTDVKINPQTNTLIRDGVRSVVNPFDVFAVEFSLRLKEKHGGQVTAITMGPPQAKHALEEVMAMGVDNASLVSHSDFAGSDTLATSYILAQAIKKIGNFDLVVCGKQAQDGDTAQVGPGIAVRLSIPQITFVRGVREKSSNFIVLERMTDAGYDVVKAKLPALVTVTKEIGTVRYASFLGKVRAKRSNIPTWGPKDINCDATRIGLDGSPTWVDKIFPPDAKKGCRPMEATRENIERVAEEIKSVMRIA